MTVQCVECVHLSRKDTPREFREIRFLRCRKGKVGEFMSPVYPRECAKFKAAPADEVQARLQWINSKPGGRAAEESQQ